MRYKLQEAQKTREKTLRVLNVVRDRTELDTTNSARVHRTKLVEFSELCNYSNVQHEFSSVIFDFDGTLANSMWVWDDIDVMFCNKFGVEIPNGLLDKLAILGFEDTANYFIEQLGVKMTVEEICAHFNDLAFDRYATEVELWPGVREYLDILANRGVGLAIATALSWPLLEAALKHNGIFEYFDDIAFCDESYSKDRPDVFLLAAKRIGAKPKDCLVFEDTARGTNSARSVGMTACGIYDKKRCSDRLALETSSDFVLEDYYPLVLAAQDVDIADVTNNNDTLCASRAS